MIAPSPRIACGEGGGEGLVVRRRPLKGDDIAARLVALAVDVVKSSESQSTPPASIAPRP
jgi:hypothetical protein